MFTLEPRFWRNTEGGKTYNWEKSSNLLELRQVMAHKQLEKTIKAGKGISPERAQLVRLYYKKQEQMSKCINPHFD